MLDRKLDSRFDELNAKIEKNSFKIDVLNNKIDGVAAALKAYRTDTEAQRDIYQVRED